MIRGRPAVAVAVAGAVAAGIVGDGRLPSARSVTRRGALPGSETRRSALTVHRLIR